jgi:hypothetical protein
MGSRLDEAAGRWVRDWTRRPGDGFEIGRGGREMGSRLDEEDSVAVAERVECIVESLSPHSYRDQSRMSYNQTDERMKEQILLEALIVHC